VLACLRMTSTGTSRSGHSALGVASSTLSILPLVLFASASALVLYLTWNDPPGADQTGYGFGLIMLSLLTALSQVVALGLGVAGTLQRQRKRTLALVGVVCSVLVLAWINSEVGGLGRLAFGILEQITNPPEIPERCPEGITCGATAPNRR
jgi:hypothetical protein